MANFANQGADTFLFAIKVKNDQIWGPFDNRCPGMGQVAEVEDIAKAETQEGLAQRRAYLCARVEQHECRLIQCEFLVSHGAP
jgi:hypothetical protein